MEMIQSQERQDRQTPNPDQLVIYTDQPNSTIKRSASPHSSPPPPPPQEASKAVTAAKAKTLRRLNISKPKSRFADTNYPLPSKAVPGYNECKPLNTEDSSSSSSDEFESQERYDDEEEDELSQRRSETKRMKMWKRKIKKIPLTSSCRSSS